MSLTSTPSGERVHIGFFGLRNAGKSSVVNAVTGQSLSVVSDVKGTTTDPVQKAMELLPIGPVVIIDTAGIDDDGMLGELRVQKTRQMLRKTDIAVLVTVGEQLAPEEEALLSLFRERSLPYIIVYNKADLLKSPPAETDNTLAVSALTGWNIGRLKEKLGTLAPKKGNDKRLVGDLLSEGDSVVLVTPIDDAAPKGRLILPQQQTIRDVLDAGAMAFVTKETDLSAVLPSLAAKPRLVITDSQAFSKVAKTLPDDIPLTSFSILFARYKGELEMLVDGAQTLDRLCDGDRILISEGCTHHRQCGDIGTVKLPQWIRRYTGKEIEFTFTSGGSFPDDVSGFALIVHCGACMLNDSEMRARMQTAAHFGVPMTNYGMTIAHINGILERSLEPLKN